MWDDLRDVIRLLVSPGYAPFVYDKHRFLAAVQSVEALHAALFDNKELPPDQHSARVTAVIQACRSANADSEVVGRKTAPA